MSYNFDFLQNAVKKHLNIKVTIQDREVERIKDMFDKGILSAIETEKRLLKKYKEIK